MNSYLDIILYCIKLVLLPFPVGLQATLPSLSAIIITHLTSYRLWWVYMCHMQWSQNNPMRKVLLVTFYR